MSHTNRETCIVFVIEALTVGGAEQMSVTMANRFVARGWSVHMICLTSAGEFAAQLDPAISLHVLGKKRGLDWQLAPRLRRLLNEINPVAINSHLWTANFWTRLALPFTRRRIVVTEHSRDTWKPGYFRFIDRVLSRWTFRLIAVSTDTLVFYIDEIGIDPARCRVINNGIDTDHFSRGDGDALRAEWAPDNELLIGTVGRLAPAKNHLRLIETVRLLDSQTDHFKVVIVGEGALRGQIEAAIESHQLGHRVALVGARGDMPDVLAALDLLVLSSDREGHPLTALEAQAAGTPVVLTDVGGCRDAIAREGDTSGGVVVEKSAEALASAIASLARDPDLRASMARVAKSAALAQFDLEKMVDSYQDCFLGN